MLQTADPALALNFFSGRGVQPRFPKCGACDLTFATDLGELVSLKMPLKITGGKWAVFFQIWGLVIS